MASSRLLDHVRAAIRARHFSRRTEKAYVGWTRRYILFHHKQHPNALGEGDVRRFLSFLSSERQISASTHNQALAALLFLYRAVLSRDAGWGQSPIRAHRPGRLPVVLTKTEVAAVLSRLSGPCRLVADLLYGAGLRLLECLTLRIKDLDLERGEIRVRDGKGGKDRVTMLPSAVRAALRAQLERVRALHLRDVSQGAGFVDLPDSLRVKYPSAGRELAWHWIFPATRQYRHRETGEIRRHHLHESVVQRAFKDAVRGAGLSKAASCHTLRHHADNRIMPTALSSPLGGRWRSRVSTSPHRHNQRRSRNARS